MKKIIATVLFVLIFVCALSAAEFASTKDGQIVFLSDDGTWRPYGFNVDIKAPYIGKWVFPSDYSENLVNSLLDESGINPDDPAYASYREVLLTSPKVAVPDVTVDIGRRNCTIHIDGDNLRLDYDINETTGQFNAINENGSIIPFGVFSPDYTSLVILGDSRLTMVRVQ